MVLKERKNLLSFILKAFNLSTVEFLYLARSTVDRLKALKINESYFFILSKPSMFMTLCHTLVGYLISFVYISLNCVFLREEAELPTRPPPPSVSCLSEISR
jgi:hypothetical protein